MEHGPDWPARVAASVGKRVAYFRDRTKDEQGRKLTAQGLADRCAELGLPLARPTIAKLEKGLRETITVGEVQVLARALGVSPLMLLFPLGQAETAEVLPGKNVAPFDAMQWFADEAELTEGPGGRLAATRHQWRHDHPRVVDDYHLFQTHQELVSGMLRQLRQAAAGELTPSPGQDAGVLDGSVRLIKQYRAFIRDRDLMPPVLPAEVAAYVEAEGAGMQPVAAAIVVSDLGVLVGRRNDGKPPWTFIAGEVEPGELAEDAAIREVKEETGLRIRAGKVIGQRIHPKTGRTMIYMAAAPTHGTEVFVGDNDELAEVRWVSLAEAGELLPGMFEPVREHLARELGEG